MVSSINSSISFNGNYKASFDKNRLRALCHLIQESNNKCTGGVAQQVQQNVHFSIPTHLEHVFESIAEKCKVNFEKLPESVQSFLGKSQIKMESKPLEEIRFATLA